MGVFLPISYDEYLTVFVAPAAVVLGLSNENSFSLGFLYTYYELAGERVPTGGCTFTAKGFPAGAMVCADRCWADKLLAFTNELTRSSSLWILF